MKAILGSMLFLITFPNHADHLHGFGLTLNENISRGKRRELVGDFDAWVNASG